MLTWRSTASARPRIGEDVGETAQRALDAVADHLLVRAGERVVVRGQLGTDHGHDLVRRLGQDGPQHVRDARLCAHVVSNLQRIADPLTQADKRCRDLRPSLNSMSRTNQVVNLLAVLIPPVALLLTVLFFWNELDRPDRHHRHGRHVPADRASASRSASTGCSRTARSQTTALARVHVRGAGPDGASRAR